MGTNQRYIYVRRNHESPMIHEYEKMFKLKCFDTINKSVLQSKVLNKTFYSGARIFKTGGKIRKLWVI